MKEISLFDYLQMIRDGKECWWNIYDYCDEHGMVWAESDDGWWIDDVFVSTAWLNGEKGIYMNGLKKGK